MREALALAALACACGMTARPPPSTAIATATGTPTSTLTSTSASTPTATGTPLAPDLSSRWSPSLPGMHVIAAREASTAPVELARAGAADLCLRIAFDASDPVTATLTNSAGIPLATSPEELGGLLPAGGPVCIRRGDAVLGSAAGPPGVRIGWMAWSPGP